MSGGMKGMRGKDVKLIIIISRRLRLRLRPGTGRERGGREEFRSRVSACEEEEEEERKRWRMSERRKGGIWGMGVRGKFSLPPPRLTTPHSSAKAREGEGEETGGVRRREGMKLRGKNTNGVPPPREQEI